MTETPKLMTTEEINRVLQRSPVGSLVRVITQHFDTFKSKKVFYRFYEAIVESRSGRSEFVDKVNFAQSWRQKKSLSYWEQARTSEPFRNGRYDFEGMHLTGYYLENEQAIVVNVEVLHTPAA